MHGCIGYCLALAKQLKTNYHEKKLRFINSNNLYCINFSFLFKTRCFNPSAAHKNFSAGFCRYALS